MRLAEREADLLRRLGRVPFADRLDLVCLSGWSRGSVYEGIDVLSAGGLVSSVPHATPLLSPTRRFHVTGAGLSVLARLDGRSVDDLLLSRPVSDRWVRILMERLDGVAVIYRLASAISGVCFPIELRWYRSMPLDAAISLPSGRTVGIVRQGPTSGRTGFAKRMWRLREGPTPGTLFVLVPDPVRLRQVRRLMAGMPAVTYLALERDVATAGAADRVWRIVSGPALLDLRTALGHAGSGRAWPAEEPLAGAAVPEDIAGRHDRESAGLDGPLSGHLLPAVLRPAEKRVLDLLWDWPWITPSHLCGLLGVEVRSVSKSLADLEERRLLVRVRAQGRRRLALSDLALAMLARRDRTSVGHARRRWSVEPVAAASSLEWRSVSGARSRQLLRHIGHTEAVHWFVAALSRQAHDAGCEVVQLDPPHRASRYFRHRGRLHSVHPDAYGALRKHGIVRPFFLEWERRAVRPVTMASRLAPYLRYYASRRPIDDHGAVPSVLVVFEEGLAAGQFLRVARDEMRGSRVEFPLWVSDRSTLEGVGPLGLAWKNSVPAEPACVLS